MRKFTHIRAMWSRSLALQIGLGAAVLTAGTMAQAADGEADQPPEYFYSYFKQPIPLRMHPDRIAVKSEVFPDRPELTLAPFGVKEAETLLKPIDGWAIALTPLDSRSEQGVQGLADAANFLGATEFVSPVFFRDGDEDDWMTITPEILIGFMEGVTADDAKQVLGAFELQVLEQDFGDMPGVWRVRSPERNGLDVLATANALAELEQVKFAEPDMLASAKPSVIPSDPFFGQTWGLHNTGATGGTADMDMDAPEAWDITQGSVGVIVVVLDSGVDPVHPDINQIAGRNFTTGVAGGVPGGGPVNACDNHGTWVAGCITGRINNGVGSVGIAPNCRVASARIAVSNTSCNGFWAVQTSWYTNALAWSRSIGAKVTNHSGFMGYSATIENAYLTARNAGIIHFAAAGNDSANTISFPARIVGTVNAVGAVDSSGNRAAFSNIGSELDFAAPGVGIVTTDRSGAASIAGDYAIVNGTSFASPYAAGVAALLFSKFSCLTPSEAESMMRASAVDRGTVGFDVQYGWGMVNANGALRARPANVFPAIPANVAASDGTMDSAVFVSWNLSSLAGGYDIYRSTSLSGTYAKVGEAHFPSSSYWYDFSATPGLTYYYKVKALRGCLESELGAANSGWRKLAPPQSVAATDGLYGSVGVSWTAVQGATHYRVFRSRSNDPATATALGSGWQSTLTFSDATATGNVTHYYWVKAATSSSGARPSNFSLSNSGWMRTIVIPYPLP